MKLCECKCGMGMCASGDSANLIAAIGKLSDKHERWKLVAELFIHCIGIPEQYADAGHEINEAIKRAQELEK